MGVSHIGTKRAPAGSDPALRLRAAARDTVRRDAEPLRDAAVPHDAAVLRDDGAWHDARHDEWGNDDPPSLDPPPPPAVAAVAADDAADAAGIAETAASAASRRPRTTSLHGIAGVRSGDGDAERHRIVRDRPRLAFRQIHALMAVLLLTAALCASLTMLLQQSLRYESALAETRAQLQSDEASSSSDSSDTTTSDGGREESSASSQSGSNGVTDEPAAGDDATGVPLTGGNGPNGSSGNIAGNNTGGASGGDDTATQSDGSATSGTATQPVNDGLIDLNTASAEELQTIKGIGPVTADRIIAYRKQIGRFSSVDQLLEVKGIGAKTLAKIRDQVAAR